VENILRLFQDPSENKSRNLSNLVGKISLYSWRCSNRLCLPSERTYFEPSVAELGTGARESLNCLVANTLIIDGRIVRADGVLKGARRHVARCLCRECWKKAHFRRSRVRKPSVLPRRAQAAVFSFPVFERMVRYNLEGKDAIDANSSEFCLRRNLNLKRPLRELPEDLNPFRRRLSSNLVHADKDGCVLGWINRDHSAEP
jgi:hypothetical protein